MISRRKLIQTTSAAGLLVGLQALVPAWAWQATGLRPSSANGNQRSFDLAIGRTDFQIDGQTAHAKTINGTVPGPLLRFKEGETVTLRVRNDLDEDTSIHWHGILLPAEMDGVPGISFPGIRPGETFEYRYTLKQSGTYWYHSHSGLQEQSGVYGPMIVDPAEPDPIGYDREYVVMLSDWTFENPDHVFAKLKKQSDYYNFQKRTIGDFFRDASEHGLGETLSDRLAWGRMRMDPTDIADITAATYTYLINGQAPSSNWTALFRPGERIRLRFINAAAMTYFNLRIPGIAMTVVQADGQNVQPVTVDEFQIGVAETYDVIVEPKDNRAYTIFAESMDRSGYARATLAPREGMAAAIPELRERPTLTMADMGMAHGDMGAMGGEGGHGQSMDHSGHDMPEMAESMRMDHGGHGAVAALPVTYATTGERPPDLKRVGVDAIAEMPTSRLHEPGTGLEDVSHRVLVYTDLRNTHGAYDPRPPGREIILHLTGNMERYMWSFDGKKFTEVKGPIPFEYGERLRLTMINNTMMNHPIHLHGMWMELDNGAGAHKPRKHTVNVKPGEKLSVEVTADAPGDWAFHCHLLYHMKAGMFRVVSVTQKTAEARQ
ncbi:MAG: copper resistance system multicopper oxidase [Parvibaculaceae bacterium]